MSSSTPSPDRLDSSTDTLPQQQQHQHQQHQQQPKPLLKERRGLALLKIGRGTHSLRHVWFNPHDPMFLRYAPEADFRGVKVLPLDPSRYTLTWTANRQKKGIEELINNCHRRHRLKVVEKTKGVTTTPKSWSMYFQSLGEYESWKELLTTATNSSNSNGGGSSSTSTTTTGVNNTNAEISSKWWESNYSSDGTKTQNRSNRRVLTSNASLSNGFYNGPSVTIRVEFPEQMGYIFLRVQPLDAKTLSIRRFKELLFEAMHISYHGKLMESVSNNGGANTKTKNPAITDSEEEEEDDKKPSSTPNNGVTTTTSTPTTMPKNNSTSSKYTGKRTCEICNGKLRQIVSRQMYHQEEILQQGPSFFVLQRVAVDSVDPNKVAWVETYKGETAHRYPTILLPTEVPFSGCLTTPGGMYRAQSETPGRDANVLLGMKYRKSKPKTAEQLRVERERQKLGDRIDEYDLWLLDEDATLQSALDKVATSFTGISACVVRFKLRPAREVPVVAFRVTVDRFTREIDAKGEYTCYWLTVRSGNRLQWEIRRRYQDFADLADSVAKEESVLTWITEIEQPSHRRKSITNMGGAIKSQSSPLPRLFSTPSRGKPNTNEENTRMRELETFVNAIVALPPMRETPSVALLSFLGALSTGLNPKLEKEVGDQHVVVVHVHALKDLAEFGDLILFRSVNPLSSLQRRFTGGEYDHVGMVIPRGDTGYCLLEATGEGVTCYPLEDRLVAYADGFCDLVALRKLKFERTKERLLALTNYTNRVEGRPYHLNFSTLTMGRRGGSGSDKDEKTAYFCSELVAEAMKKMGLLEGVDKRTSYWLPHHFNPGGELEQMVNPAIVKFDDIMIIDCKLVEIEFSSLV
jgi:hypothetical protein